MKAGLFSWKHVWVGLFFVIACLYATSLTVPFHFDDEHTIHMNESVHQLSGIPRLWTDITTSSYLPDNRSYRPLKYTFDTICWSMGKGATWPFHLWKIFMHSVVCLCVFLIWRRLWREPEWYPLNEGSPAFVKSELVALVTALVFAVHPAMTEVVTYISASSSLQCSMFYLLSFMAFLEWREKRGMGMLACSLVAYAASCLSKEEGITLPAVAALTALFLEQGTWKRKVTQAIKTTWPYWIALVAIGGFLYHMIPESNAKSRGTVPHIEYLFTQLRAWLWYMRLWFWPWDLNADNVEFGFSKSFTEPRVVQAFIGNLLLLGVGLFYRKRFPAFLFGLLWFYITISPASSILPLAEPVNEHRMYLSYVGFAGGVACVLVSLIYDALSPRPTPKQSFVILSLIVAGAMIGTVNRIGVWKSSESLWADTVAKNPTSGRAQNNLALIFMGRAEYAKAMEQLDLCEKYWPAYMYCPLNKGIIGLAQRNAELAEKSVMRAAALDPENPWVCFYLGRLFREIKKDPQRAIFFFKKADALTGNRYLDAKEWIARIHYESGDKEAARGLASEILRIEPNRPSAQELLRMVSQ